jgi:hypothetical protein
MTQYIVKLTEQEELTFRQIAMQPGFEVIFKLLQAESLDAQAKAMDCEEPEAKKRLMLLTDAQATQRVVGRLTRKLAAYQAPMQQEMKHPDVELIENIWNLPERKSN